MMPKGLHRFWLERCAKFIKKPASSVFMEFGVKQGSTSVIISKSLECKGYLFDTWKGFPHYSKLDAPTKSKIKKLNRRLHGSDTMKDCKSNLKKNGVWDKVDLIRGDICKTVPKFMETFPVDRENVAFIHIDTDLHDPAKVAFDNVGNLVVEGGGIFIHDYEDKHWSGIKIAVDDFVQKSGFQFFNFKDDGFYGAFLLHGNKELLNKFKDYYEQTRKSMG